MNIRVSTTIFLVSLVCLALAFADRATSATLYYADMDGTTSGTPSPGTGTVVFILNDAQNQVDYEITYAGLIGEEFASHIHSARDGDFGPIVHTLPLGPHKTGIWTVGPADVEALNQGNVYVNIHTDPYPGGEIRGNLAFQSVPTANRSWSSVKALFR